MKKTNQIAFDEACKFIVGGVNSPVRAFKAVGATPLFIESGKGAFIKDIENKAYIDFVQSWGPLLFGHCDKDITKACKKALKKGSSFGAPTLAETELAKLVLAEFPHLDKIRFVSSGTVLGRLPLTLQVRWACCKAWLKTRLSPVTTTLKASKSFLTPTKT